MKELTPRQAEILEFIRTHINETGYPPTRADIARSMGFKSPNAAEEHLKALAKKKAIEIIPNASRGIRIPDLDTPESQGLPVVGLVAAGAPLLAQENISEYCALPEDMFYPRADYLLRVSGMSMKNIGILDGDLLAVHKTNQARNGQVVVARVDDEVTVKRFERQENTVYLIAENEDYNPIEVDLTSQNLSIEGLSVGIIRRGN